MILVNEETKAIVQGITGKQGRFHTKEMLKYGTNIVAGTSPGKAGQKVEDIPVYNSIEEIKRDFPDINASIIFIPAPFVKDAAFEAISELDLVVIITEHIPIHDTMEIVEYAKEHDTILIGPNTPGIITPGVGKLGIMPTHIFNKGHIGLVSRSGTLTYEIASQISDDGYGISTGVGIGGDPVTGQNFIDILKRFENDPETEQIVMLGEIGGVPEVKAAKYAEEHLSKPIVSFIAGVSAPLGKRMGHAGAIIEGTDGTAENKKELLRQHGVHVADTPKDIVKIIEELQ
ncbi:succinate--CoA ligase subunit alpha [Methanosphaera sp. Vir-13MRS]|uniref:succinate--CoA ligase subunit alpha n=1 Tax=Candidatus Methanosphaera massiliense TaxID=3017187 RepID=UPI002380C1FC|nr:succinate--CoA ligase subunit alpha [Candidatus Methanosphaera massiliense]MDD6286508.1 succinate--CoA ligase subunit alpha [Methanobacteriaceae archaeon]MDE4078848.1 succinate--CoA ligase subunit alpha [Candidatus Methanosphaera massiliense]